MSLASYCNNQSLKLHTGAVVAYSLHPITACLLLWSGHNEEWRRFCVVHLSAGEHDEYRPARVLRSDIDPA
ncbi:hypothetical protein EYF80_061453 [Liparis tanakae]|uniref:Uncharacterized protein n=1 Tax=Liparis tanakae TaxID=230148 RepID=A0A4Z2EIL3_9TELE|nr:hypothetical protein EYF80_061453 [Liparis tanakae]